MDAPVSIPSRYACFDFGRYGGDGVCVRVPGRMIPATRLAVTFRLLTTT